MYPKRVSVKTFLTNYKYVIDSNVSNNIIHVLTELIVFKTKKANIKTKWKEIICDNV